MSSRRVLVLLVATLMVLAPGCRRPSELRPPFTSEVDAPRRELEGTIAFTGRVGRSYAIYEMPAAGGQPKRLTPPGHDERSPDYSRDGGQMAFAGLGTAPGIYVRSTNGAVRQVVGGTGFFDSPTWSPDGSRIAYSHSNGTNSSWDLFVVDAAGGEPRQLTTNTSQDWDPAWAPSDDRIAFTSDRDGDNAIWVLDLRTGSSTKLADSSAEDTQPAWSPDGRRLAFSSNRELERWQIFVLDIERDKVERGTPTDGIDRFPTWSPSGSYVLASVAYLALYGGPGTDLPGSAGRWRLTKRLALSSAWKAG